MEVGVGVWVRDLDGERSWLPAVVEAKETTKEGHLALVIRNEYGEDSRHVVTDENQELDDVKLRNDDSESDVENLINLPYLHEPAILFCLEKRYEKSDIYTYTGPILIAMNPFKKVPLYTTQILEVYYNSGLLRAQGIETGTTLPPHVYAIADAAYRQMMSVIASSSIGSRPSSDTPARRHSNSSHQVTTMSANHSILISGESGAGKTESTKIVLRYLTTVGNASGGLETVEGSVMDKVLQSNPLLEAFGNACTLRNDNSSRFGKFIELSFNKRGHLIGGTIRTYLLEKVRLPFQQRNERNFHIFYQLAAGATPAERDEWELTDIEDYDYAAQGGIFKLTHVDDLEEFQSLRSSLNTLNFAPEDQTNLLNITAALLHLGQLNFESDKTGEGSILSTEVSSLSDGTEQVSLGSAIVAARLLGVSVDELVRTLTVRKIVAMHESYDKPLTPEQASDARDALAKMIYGRLFDWIVATVNRSIQVEASLVRASIGVLDIFGFECFERGNSYEQVLINYTNETLQQQFNQYIFKMEQIEYQCEKIEWSFISFPDNQDCLDLIENRQHGILAMVDDECKLPKATDEKLASRLYKALDSHPRFSATAAFKRDCKFCIKHYAGPVVYSTLTFVEKNRDEIPKEAALMLEQSSVSLLAALFLGSGSGGKNEKSGTGNRKGAAVSPKAGSASTAQLSVGSQFKEQLHTLMDTVYATMPHYIRCLKPNDQNVSDNYNRPRITEQLRYGGVLEAVRVARSGFPVRLVHQDFYARYRALANPFSPTTTLLPAFLHQNSKPSKSSTDKTAKSKGFDPTHSGGAGSQRTAKEYCELLLEALWDERIDAEDVEQKKISKAQRRKSKIDEVNIWKGKSAVAKESIQLGLTKVFLRKPAHDLLEGRRSRRLTSAARRIQCCVRCHQMRSWYLLVRWSVLVLQCAARCMIARTRANCLRERNAAIHLQKQVRAFTCHSKYQRFRAAVVQLQCAFRGIRAFKTVNLLRMHVYSIGLQRIVRGLVVRHRWLIYRRAVVVLQNRLRKVRAKKTVKEMKIAAKDVGRLQQSNEALKQEIDALRARAVIERERIKAEMEKELHASAEKAKEEKLGNLEQQLADAMRELAEERARRLTVEKRLLDADQKLQAAEEEAAEAHATITILEMKLSDALFTAESKRQSVELTEKALAVHTANEDEHRTLQLQYEDERAQRLELSEEVVRLNALKESLHRELDIAKSTLTARATLNDHPADNHSSREMTRMLEELQMSNATVLTNKIEMDKLQAELRHLRALLSEESKKDDSKRRRSFNSENSAPNNGVAVSISHRAPTPPINPGLPTPTRRHSAYRREDQSTSTPGRRHSMKDVNALNQAIKSGDLNAASKWSNAWDDEDDGSSVSQEQSSVNTADNAHAVASTGVAKSDQIRKALAGMPSTTHKALDNPADLNSAVLVFEKNLDSFRSKLRQGVMGVLWEGQKIANEEVAMSLDQSNKLLIFKATANKRFTLFQSKVDIAPMALADIIECIPGAEIRADLAALFVTVVTKDEGRGSRILALKFATKDMRNNVLTGLRTLIAEVHMNSPTSRMLSSIAASNLAGDEVANSTISIASNSPLVSAGTNPMKLSRPTSQRNAQVSDGQRIGIADKLEAAADGGTGASKAKRRQSRGLSPKPGHPTTPVASRSTRRQSINDTLTQSRRQSVASAMAAKSTIDTDADLPSQSVEELRKDLIMERNNHERVMMQILVLTNDLNEREEQITLLQKKEAYYEQTLVERDNMYKQDAMVRMQLGKRLEQVLVEKEEALEQLQLMQDQVDSLKTMFDNLPIKK